MLRLTLVTVGLVVASACSDGSDREVPASDGPGQPVELVLADDPRPVDSTAGADSTPSSASPGRERTVSPAEESAPDPPAPRREPRARRSPPSPAPDPAPRDTAPLPEPPPPVTPSPPDTSPPPDTAGYAPYTGAEPSADTAASPSRDTAAPRTADTVAASAAAAPTPEVAPTSSASTLATGTVIHASVEDSINSRTDSEGKVVRGRLTEPVTGPAGTILIPSGSPVQFTVTDLRHARGSGQGWLTLRVDAITVDGEPRTLKAKLQPVPHELRGRGVTGEEAAKVGAGAAGGAVLGRVIGGNTRGAVIGGVVGAAGGAVVASKTARRDVVVKARTPVTFVLTAPMVTRP